MVFADVSGFTRLSERLARKGKEGAEHLVDAINACFSALLADAYERGGSLVKFGGDAMLLWFCGDGHALRACACGSAMRRTLREVGRIRAGGERRRAANVGGRPQRLVRDVPGRRLASRAADRRPVDDHRGRDGGPRLGRADPDEPGRPPRLLPRGCPAPPLGSGSCSPGRRRRPNGRRTRSAAACRPMTRSRSCLPTIVRAHLLGGHAAPEHRTRVDRLPPVHRARRADRPRRRRGARAGRLDELVRLVQEACRSLRGVLPRLRHLRRRRQDPPERRRAARGRRRRGADAAGAASRSSRPICRCRCRSGVNRGPVFTGEVGPDYRRWYAVMGDTVNLAARVMGKAPAGHMYATRDVLRRSRDGSARPRSSRSRSRARHGRCRRGTSGPRCAPESAGTARPQLPLVGRERELDALRAAIAAARRGSGCGRSSSSARPAAASRACWPRPRELGGGHDGAARDVRGGDARDAVLRRGGICSASCSGSNGTIRGASARAARGRDPAARPGPGAVAAADRDRRRRRGAGHHRGGAAGAEARATKLREVVLRFLRRALVVPTIVEVEHAHLMDAASAALFEALTRRARVVLVARAGRRARTSRRPVASGSRARSDRARAAVAQRTRRRSRWHAGGGARCRRTCSSWPSSAPEAAREFLLDLLAAAAAGDRDELPESVGAATMARIDALDPRDGAVVRRAAVLGINFHPRRLADVLAAGHAAAGRADSGTAVGRVRARAGWPRPLQAPGDPGGGLLEPAVQAAARAAHGGRAAARARAGRELDAGAGDPVAPLLARRRLRAGPSLRDGRRRARDRAVLARGRGAAVSAGDRGGAGARVARTMRGRSPRPGSSSARRCGTSGEPAAAAKALTEARRLLRDDPIAQARLCNRHAEVAERSAASLAGRAVAERAGSACLDGASRARSDGVASADACRISVASATGQGRWSQAISTCRQAIAEAEAVGELSALAHACYALDWALVESGRPDEADALLARARDLRAARRPRARVPGAQQPRRDRLLGRAAGTRRSSSIAGRAVCGERAGRPADAAMSQTATSARSCPTRVTSTRPRRTSQRARRVLSGTGERQSVAYVDASAGSAAVRRGNYAEGVAMLEAARLELRRFGMDAYAEFAHALIAEAEAFGGDPFRAMDIASQQLRANDRQRPLLTRMAGIALARLGDATTAPCGNSRHSSVRRVRVARSTTSRPRSM